MFLQALLSKNPDFISAAIALHQAGEIPANSYVIDCDTVHQNTSALMTEAHSHGLTVYAMTKQLGRAPTVLETMTDAGVDGFVAVDMACARPIVTHGHNLGHLGHLVQVPKAEAQEAVQLRPDYWTVFSLAKAQELSNALPNGADKQKVLIRVFDEDDLFYPGHEGGIALEDLATTIRTMNDLSGLEIAGVTTFPALLFNNDNGTVEPTINAKTLGRAAEIVREICGDEPRVQVNAPGTTSTAVLSMLADLGATQVEPGHGLTGTTPLHAVQDLAEQPAVLYLSEVAHIHQGLPYCFGGGLYVDPVFGDYQTTALLANGPEEIATPPVPVDMPDPAAIDYYAPLHPDPDRVVQTGATVVFGFRIQAFVTRAFVVPITGVSAGSPRVAGIYNAFGDETGWEHS